MTVRSCAPRSLLLSAQMMQMHHGLSMSRAFGKSTKKCLCKKSKVLMGLSKSEENIMEALEAIADDKGPTASTTASEGLFNTFEKELLNELAPPSPTPVDTEETGVLNAEAMIRSTAQAGRILSEELSGLVMAAALQMQRVESKVQKSLERVRLLLQAEKNPQLAQNVHHQYEDKYFLVERGTCIAIASQLNCLAALGFTVEQIQMLRAWAMQQSVSLRFQSKETCTFLREETRQEENPRKHVEEVQQGGVTVASWASKVVTSITEYFWKFEVTYSLEAFRGAQAESITIFTKTHTTELKTTCKSPAPHPEVRSPAIHKEVNVTWLCQMLTDDGPIFKISRDAKGCNTPRRNCDVDKAFAHFTMFAGWAQSIGDYLSHLRKLDPKRDERVPLSPETVFVPTLPLMVDNSSSQGFEEVRCDALARLPPGDDKDGQALNVSDGNRLLGEEHRSLQEKRAELAQCFPEEGLYTSQEAFLHVTLLHSIQNSESWSFLVEYVEEMLRKQLVAAIGKEVSPALFAAYMKFHYRKLLREDFQPTQFCFAVRRSEKHSLEGTVSIEEQTVGLDDAQIKVPIVTFAKCTTHQLPMTFPLDASTKATFTGDVHLHGWLCHRFSGQSSPEICLTSRARQFSSMLVMVGRITSATNFEPTHAAIVQNKDQLTIPLELSMIPTPKEFRDAISSLSPEMQSFAKSFRAMQLESTLFGVLVVQIKPQLERLLNLPSDSLTKEIKLTQDLMDLLMTYQIPSDLLSFDDVGDSEPTSSVDAVKQHVQGMLDMIQIQKDEEIQAARLAARATTYGSYRDGGRRDRDRDRDDRHCRSRSGRASSRLSLSSRSEEEEEGESLEPECEEESRSREEAKAEKVEENDGRSQAPAPGSSKKPRIESEDAEMDTAGTSRDYTKVPKEMDARFEKFASDSALRPTIIKVSGCWQKRSKQGLLAPETSDVLWPEQQKQQKDAAFDLLDAITKSGALPLTHASLHIVIASTHCFDKTVMETVIQDNLNPIDRVARSTLVMASTVHQQPVKSIVNEANLKQHIVPKLLYSPSDSPASPKDKDTVPAEGTDVAPHDAELSKEHEPISPTEAQVDTRTPSPEQTGEASTEQGGTPALAVAAAESHEEGVPVAETSPKGAAVTTPATPVAETSPEGAPVTPAVETSTEGAPKTTPAAETSTEGPKVTVPAVETSKPSEGVSVTSGKPKPEGPSTPPADRFFPDTGTETGQSGDVPAPAATTASKSEGALAPETPKVNSSPGDTTHPAAEGTVKESVPAVAADPVVPASADRDAAAAEDPGNLLAELMIDEEMKQICGLFGSDLELLEANKCPEKLGCSRSAVLWARDTGNDLTLEVGLNELPEMLEHLVLATVGKTGIDGGHLNLSMTAGRFQHQYQRSQIPDHGRNSFAQGSMLAVLSRTGHGWLLQEVVPNIGLSCEQQEDATVRELYWPEVGVAIERTVTTDAGPSITWLEVFKAYPEGAYPSDDDTETASASPMGSKPEVVPSLSPSSELDKASIASEGPCVESLPLQMSSFPASLSQKHVHPSQLRDFGPPRALGDLGDRHEVAELCQETGRLSVSLKLSEDRLSKSESMVAHLRSELTKLQEDKRSSWQEASLKETKVLRLRSELDHCQSELQQKMGILHAQQEELEQMAKSRAKEIAKQERCKGEVTALQQELLRVNQQLLQERGAWEQDKEVLQLSLQECTTEVKAAKMAQGNYESDLEKLRHELCLEKAEAAKKRAETLERKKQVKGKAWPEGTQQSDLETLQAELSKIQSTFAEELGSARARLAVAEKRNSDLLEQLQSTLRAASTKMDRPSSLPDPPRSIPSRLVSERSFKDAKDEGKSPQSDDLQRAAWSRQRKQAEQHLWELHSQQKNRSEQLARQQQECQWQQLQSSCRSLSSEGSCPSRDFGRLPSAPPSGSNVGETLRRAAAERRQVYRATTRATRALDDEYARFVKEGSRRVERPQISSRDLMKMRERQDYREPSVTEPFVLSDMAFSPKLRTEAKEKQETEQAEEEGPIEDMRSPEEIREQYLEDLACEQAEAEARQAAGAEAKPSPAKVEEQEAIKDLTTSVTLRRDLARTTPLFREALRLVVPDSWDSEEEEKTGRKRPDVYKLASCWEILEKDFEMILEGEFARIDEEFGLYLGADLNKIQAQEKDLKERIEVRAKEAEGKLDPGKAQELRSMAQSVANNAETAKEQREAAKAARVDLARRKVRARKEALRKSLGDEPTDSIGKELLKEQLPTPEVIKQLSAYEALAEVSATAASCFRALQVVALRPPEEGRTAGDGPDAAWVGEEQKKKDLVHATTEALPELHACLEALRKRLMAEKNAAPEVDPKLRTIATDEDKMTKDDKREFIMFEGQQEYDWERQITLKMKEQMRRRDVHTQECLRRVTRALTRRWRRDRDRDKARSLERIDALLKSMDAAEAELDRIRKEHLQIAQEQAEELEGERRRLQEQTRVLMGAALVVRQEKARMNKAWYAEPREKRALLFQSLKIIRRLHTDMINFPVTAEFKQKHSVLLYSLRMLEGRLRKDCPSAKETDIQEGPLEETPELKAQLEEVDADFEAQLAADLDELRALSRAKGQRAMAKEAAQRRRVAEEYLAPALKEAQDLVLRSERAARRTEIAEDLLRPVAMLSSQLGAEAFRHEQLQKGNCEPASFGPKRKRQEASLGKTLEVLETLLTHLDAEEVKKVAAAPSKLGKEAEWEEAVEKASRRWKLFCAEHPATVPEEQETPRGDKTFSAQTSIASTLALDSLDGMEDEVDEAPKKLPPPPPAKKQVPNRPPSAGSNRPPAPSKPPAPGAKAAAQPLGGSGQSTKKGAALLEKLDELSATMDRTLGKNSALKSTTTSGGRSLKPPGIGKGKR
eukprot:symbB.v1.2.008649.t1/scaffold540.1/size189765/14